MIQWRVLGKKLLCGSLMALLSGRAANTLGSTSKEPPDVISWLIILVGGLGYIYILDLFKNIKVLTSMKLEPWYILEWFRCVGDCIWLIDGMFFRIFFFSSLIWNYVLCCICTCIPLMFLECELNFCKGKNPENYFKGSELVGTMWVPCVASQLKSKSFILTRIIVFIFIKKK